MAQSFYGINRGQNQEKVVLQVGLSNGTDIEVRLDSTKGVLESELLLALEKITNFIIKNVYPPA